RIGIMQSLVKFKLRTLPRLLDGPACEAPRDFGHILLCVAAIDANRVEFHELAAVVFIQSAFVLLLLLPLLWARRQRPAKTAISPLLSHGALRRQPLRRARIGA